MFILRTSSGFVQLRTMPSTLESKLVFSTGSVTLGLEEEAGAGAEPLPLPPPQAASNRVVKIKLARCGRRVSPVRYLPELSPDAGLCMVPLSVPLSKILAEILATFITNVFMDSAFVDSAFVDNATSDNRMFFIVE